MNDFTYLIDLLMLARPANDPALFDSGTRSAYERGFEQMRALALHAVKRASSAPAGQG